MDSTETSSPKVEYKYDDRIVGWFLVAAVKWAVLAALATAATWWIFLHPDSFAKEYTFARIGAIHVNLAIYAFAANLLFAGVYFSTQRLCKRDMWSPGLSYLHFFGWQFVNIWGLATLFYGHAEYRMGQEFVLPLDIGICIAMLLFATNLIGTIAKRRNRHIYVSLWYYLASAIVVVPIQLLCNLAIPVRGYESISLLWGAQDGFAQAWGQQAMIFYLLVMPAMGMMYYFVPKGTGQPIRSYRLVIIQFWAMTFLGLLSASRVLHYTAAPEWVTSIGMLAGVILFLPSWVGVTNGLSMLRKASSKELAKSPILQLFLVAVGFYALLTIESAFSSIKSVSVLTVFTDWTLAHVYCVTFGWAGLIGFGAAYWIVPQISHRALWNKDLMRIQMWIIAVGTVLLVLPLYISGYLQGSMNRSVDSTGTLVYPEFIEIVQSVSILWWSAFVGAVLCTVGAKLASINVALTWLFQDRKYKAIKTLAPKPSADYEDPPGPKSVLEGQAVLAFGVKLDQWRHFAFHRKWERKTSVFVTLISAAVLTGVLLQFVPAFAFGNRLPLGATAQPYTPLELVGRSVFVREGCVQCHTQTVRPLVAEVDRYGDFSKPQDFYYDHPAQWGTRRVGPDLAREGGRQNGWWHWQHLEDPRLINPDSVMPSFSHLMDAELDVDSIRELLRAENALGVPYDESLLKDDELTVEDRLYGEVTELEAKIQSQAEAIAADIVKSGGPAAMLNSEATALIAYLQRLGAPPQASN